MVLKRPVLSHLQKVSDDTDDTSKGTTGDGGAGSGTLELWWSWDGGGTVVGWWRDWGTSWDNDGGVWVGDNVSWDTRASALTDGSGDGGVGLDAGAWAVGDGQGSWLGDGVGNVVLDNGGWERAVSGVGRDGLGDGDLSSVSISGNDTDESSNGGDESELHFEFELLGIKINRCCWKTES